MHHIARSSKVLRRSRQGAACVRSSLRTSGILPNRRTNSFTHAVRSAAWPPMELMPFTCTGDTYALVHVECQRHDIQLVTHSMLHGMLAMELILG